MVQAGAADKFIIKQQNYMSFLQFAYCFNFGQKKFIPSNVQLINFQKQSMPHNHKQSLSPTTGKSLPFRWLTQLIMNTMVNRTEVPPLVPSLTPLAPLPDQLPRLTPEVPICVTSPDQLIMPQAQAPTPNYPNYEYSFGVVLQGVVLKKTMNSSWQRRYFCLTGSRLMYYLESDMAELKGCFNLGSLCRYGLQIQAEDQIIRLCVRVYEEQNQQNFEVKQLVSLYFQQDRNLCEKWKTNLRCVIRNLTKNYDPSYHPAIGADQILNPVPKISGNNFWNKLQISNKQLLSYGDHLDIIFFKSSKPIASLHRLFMRSKYDHVAILLRGSNNKLLVLEAIEARGVWVNEWDQMLPTFRQHYDQIAYRKLILDEKSSIDFEKLEDYLDAVIGNDYELSLTKLVIGDSEFNSNGSESSSNSGQNAQQKKSLKEKTFFCSELIADIYIKAGLIRDRKGTDFWPRDFENELQLREGAQLGPLMLVNF